MVKSSKPLEAKLTEINAEELYSIVEQAAPSLDAEQHAKLKAAMDTLIFFQEELKRKGVSIARLQQIAFGSKTEKTSKALRERKKQERKRETKSPGHGRRSAAAYTGAERVKVPHDSLRHGEGCPECLEGKVYHLPKAKNLVRITGVAPLSATVWECERLRCNFCGEVFSAEPPKEVGTEKYDESATSMIGLLKYGCGLPFNRIQKFQQGMGIPLPAATQWELVQSGAKRLEPVYEELIREAAQGEVLHNDDTTAKILELSGEQREAAVADGESRTGVYTSGIISTRGKRGVALFFTGNKHAGENLSVVLKKRAAELPPPIHMCDALSANIPKEFETILAHCNAHGRRKFYELLDSFPNETRHVLDIFSELYKTDALTRELTAEERLRFHQERSGPLMSEFETWLHAELDERRVEPNSALGKAIRHLIDHWQAFTLFLRVPGAPLDNNICERALKKAILHRKNSLFFKTRCGAQVADIYMSLIYSAEIAAENPFDYILELLRHADAVRSAPAEWLPWNYRETLDRVGAATTS